MQRETQVINKFFLGEASPPLHDEYFPLSVKTAKSLLAKHAFCSLVLNKESRDV